MKTWFTIRRVKASEMIEFLGSRLGPELPKFLRQRWACSNCIEVAGSSADLHAFPRALERLRRFSLTFHSSAFKSKLEFRAETLSRNAVGYISEEGQLILMIGPNDIGAGR